MSEDSMAVVKPEMKSYIWLQTTDGSIQQVEEEVAMFCPMICREVLQTGMGSSKKYAIVLPQRVNPPILGLILDYCQFHQVPGRSNKECKTFDEKFIRMDTKKLCELTSAADSLQLKPLVDLTSRALARIIEGKTPEEIRETFHLPDDLTEEEKLEPLRNITDDPRIRLLNRLYARKRKELKEREKLKNVEVEEERVDERSVDDLLSFINGGDGDSKGVRISKNKKKNRRRKEHSKESSSNQINGDVYKELDQVSTNCSNGEAKNSMVATPSETSKVQDVAGYEFSSRVEFDDGDMDDDIDPMDGDMDDDIDPARKEELAISNRINGDVYKDLDQVSTNCSNGEAKNSMVATPSKTSKVQDVGGYAFSSRVEFDDGDMDDDIDPARKEELDREVEDFARRLNSDWPERMQEILSLGQEKKHIPISRNSNGSNHACISLDQR